jgi:hypothetical protein
LRLGRRGRGQGPRRILVVANETLGGRALRQEIAHRARGPSTDVWVVCPALNTKIRHWTSDEDEARARAQQRLRETLEVLQREGFDADGDVGEADPVQAMEDALRLFPADEAIVSTLALARTRGRPAGEGALRHPHHARGRRPGA